MCPRSLARYAGLVSLSLILILGGWLQRASADEKYSSGIIQLVLPQPAGGAVDLIARMLATPLAVQLGQPVVIESRPGANGSLAAEYVARAKPDGHTLFVAIDTNLTVNPHLYSNLKYDPYRDFAPIGVVAFIPDALLENPSLKANSIPELIELAKSKPGVINYASVGFGSAMHVGMEYFKAEAGIDLTHVPYKGASTALPDLFRGAVSLMLLGEQTAATYTKSGQIKTLAVTSLHRSKSMPDVPAIAETIPGFEVRGWVGVLAPAGTPKNIQAKLVHAIQSAVATPEFVEAMVKQGLIPGGSTRRSRSQPHEPNLLLKVRFGRL